MTFTETATDEIPRLRRQLVETMIALLELDPNAVLVIQDSFQVAAKACSSQSAPKEKTA